MEKQFKMTMCIFAQYKRAHNTIPRCVSCGNHLLVNDKIERITCDSPKLVKYVCGLCSKKFSKTGILVYQKATGTKRKACGEKLYKKKDNWIHEIQSTTSM